MTEYWQCAFIGEGTSDNGLAKVLERLLMSMRPGADVNLEPHGWTGRRPNNAEEKIKALAEEPYDLIFVHRDADNVGIEARIKECRSPGDDRVVPVIPVTMTEAWVLADLWSKEESFQPWASRQGFRLAGIEDLADPKRTLKEYLNRDRSRFMTVNAFERKRSKLVGQIRIDGDVKHLEAWKRLEKELESAVVRNRQHLSYQ
ncbi:hypothetical protein CWT12_08980 [Actinomyces sp. 432]|uniref:hypothetical protein n=1 Tax=Actinomyces sp. 432 TaxID=2057798 RepID=UPI0013744812|nr:hypothetical protein [Actinomyces sp. 432]QHO91412.1 hypothetical protein CWT12_08980 [Actinomyces sp. 432]